MQVFWSNLWLGLSVCLSCLSAHDLSEKAGVAPLAVGPLPQFPDPDGHSQPAGSILCVEKLKQLPSFRSFSFTSSWPSCNLKEYISDFRWESLFYMCITAHYAMTTSIMAINALQQPPASQNLFLWYQIKYHTLPVIKLFFKGLGFR